MAVYSMTGYATTAAGTPTEAGSDHTRLVAEARSVNGRFLDLSFRLPDELRSLEPALRELCTQALRRGKVEVRFSLAREEHHTWPQPGHEQLARLARVQDQIHSWMPKAQPLSVHEVLGWCKGGAATSPMEEPALAAMRKCLHEMQASRAREGAKLAALLLERVATLRELAKQAQPLIPCVVQRQQQRFLERWEAALSLAGAPSAGAQPPTGKPASASAQAGIGGAHERALAEAAAYALRIDVAEELGRLEAHLSEIERLLKSGGELGKRLDFIIQELNREANTLGSKATALELTNISVQMKVAIEQMREQVQNLE